MELKIEYMALDKLKPYEKNARKHQEADLSTIKASISEFGMSDPIGVWGKDNIIVEGHGRYLACKDLGIDEVPVIHLDHLTDEQRRAYALAHNKTAEMSEWDFDLLGEELADILDIDMSDFGFDLSDDEEEETEVIEDEVPQEVEPVAKQGDIWQLGRHRLMCGDSTSVTDIEKLMDGNKADIVLSDPPYGMNLDTDFSTIKGSMKSIGKKNHTQGNKYNRVIGDNEDFKPELISTFFDNFGYVKEMFLFGADYYAELLQDKNNGSWLVWNKRKPSQADAIGSEFELCWSKTKHKRRMLRHDWFGFLSSENQQDARNRVHPTQKPITLIVDILNQWGNGCSNVIDLYGGSGSTLIACEQLDRTCYMMELDPHYVDVIIARWEKFTGQKAVLLNGNS